MAQHLEIDVAIIGAGAAGLAAYLRLDAGLDRALTPVLDDLSVTCAVQPTVESWGSSEDANPSAMFWAPDGSGSGVGPCPDSGFAEQVAHLADQVQAEVGAAERLVGSMRNGLWLMVSSAPSLRA